MELPDQNDNQIIRYEYIIKKLYNTLNVYGAIFPQLLQVGEFLSSRPRQKHQAKDLHQELLVIVNFLKDRAVKDYIVRHLYHNFRREVEAFQQGIPLDEEKEFYINVPG